ncbi:hypothetical protein ACIPZC_06880 [Pseudomonas sp. NPDC089743]|uniref:hypothetical protein n=1 Tax=Pseudomonas sp. NPDC089743 TaxID=3364471 RepID=UPI0037F18FAB
MQKKILTHVPCARPFIPDIGGNIDHSTPPGVEWVYAGPIDSIQKLPIILLNDGSVWEEGTAFLISRLLDKDFNRTTLQFGSASRKADDLVFFMRVLEELGIDYRADERFKIRRPTYAFLEEISNRVNKGFSQESAIRIVGVIVEFYKWRDYTTQCLSVFPRWVESARSRTTVDRMGVEIQVAYTTNDLVETLRKMPIEADPNFIWDEAKLKPLTPEQQELMIQALYGLGNTEMFLGFLIALETSARIQTVFTLRSKAFKRVRHVDERVVRITIGKGSDVDNKRNRKHHIEIPDWLYDKLHIYSKSRRHFDRSTIKCKLPEDKKYLFYTAFGNPYYTGRLDKLSTSHTGGAVRVFLCTKLIPKLKSQGHNMKFRFHDLRASYGCNKLDHGLTLVEAGKLTLDAVMRNLQDSMGHSDIRVTYRYLNYRGNHPTAQEVSSEWEQKILKDILSRLGLLE